MDSVAFCFSPSVSDADSASKFEFLCQFHFFVDLPPLAPVAIDDLSTLDFGAAALLASSIALALDGYSGIGVMSTCCPRRLVLMRSFIVSWDWVVVAPRVNRLVDPPNRVSSK